MLALAVRVLVSVLIVFLTQLLNYIIAYKPGFIVFLQTDVG